MLLLTAQQQPSLQSSVSRDSSEIILIKTEKMSFTT